MRIVKYILLSIILSSGVLNAQEEFGSGSPYTIFGLGDIQYYSSNRTEGMGINGVSLTGDYINNLNPAANYKLGFTIFSMGFNYKMLQSKGNSTSDATQSNISGFNFAVPVYEKFGVVFNFGFNPMTQVNYKILLNSYANGTPVAETFAGSGGISRINVGSSFTPFSNVSLGFEYNYAFGVVKSLELIDFQNSNITNSYRKSENTFTGSFVKGGIVLNPGRMFHELKATEFYIGAFIQSPLNLNSDLESIWKTSLPDNDTTRFETAKYKYPLSYGIGISNKFGDRYTVAGDVVFQNWADFKIKEISQPGLQNSMRISLGVEIAPPDRSNLTFWSNKYYRFGAFYEKTNFYVNNEGINGYGLSLGIGIPLSKYNILDLSASYSHRGKTENGLIKEDLIKFSAGFNFGELWFIRTRDEDR